MSFGNAHVLPDSRAKNPKGTQLGEMRGVSDGKLYRVEMFPLYCASCGKEVGTVCGNVSFVCYLCNQCFESYGMIAGTYAVPDDQFNEAMVFEMETQFGKSLTADEIAFVIDRDMLGDPLKKLMAESPFDKATKEVSR